MPGEIVSCPKCGKEMHAGGLHGHLQFKHPEVAIKTQRISENKSQEGSKVSAEGYCPGCHQKEREIDQLNHKMEKEVEGKSKAEQETAAALKVAEDAKAESMKPLTEEQKSKIAQEHFRDCPDCRRAIIDSVRPEVEKAVRADRAFITAAAEEMGIAPKRILIRARQENA